MSYQEVLHRNKIAISASDSPDTPFLGLSEAHFVDAMTEIARHLLALGAQLYYGGDLRANGFSELLFEVVKRHRRDVDDADSHLGVTNFLAWPVHIRMPFDAVANAAAELAGIAELVCLDETGARQELAARRAAQTREPSGAEWAKGLTSMRQMIHAETRAHIVLGGQVENYKGAMPGIAEEALLSISAGSPIYLVGGFGGCARDIAETVGLATPWAPLARQWQGRSAFEKFNPEHIKNGLTIEENQILARTPHADQAVILILKGLMNLDT